MTAQPITVKAMRRPPAPGLAELSALALIWGIARAITETPPDALTLFLDEVAGGFLPAEEDTRTR